MKSLRPVDLQYFAGEKTERATPKKREEGRKKGQVIKSIDLSTAISLFAFFLCLMIVGGRMGEKLTGMMIDVFTNRLNTNLSEENVHSLFVHLAVQSAEMLAPFLIVALVVGVAGQMLQVGFLFNPESIQFKLERIDPIKGFKRIYSLRAIVEFLKSVLKITIIGTITFSILWLNRENILATVNKSLADGLHTMAKVVLSMGLSAAIGLIILALLDYLYQKYDYEKNMRMSKQDIKDEFKNTEGDPLIRSKVRERQRQMAMKRMMQELPKADVVITNPTHFAVALKYEASEMSAPKVVAKGADYLALKIKEIARKNEIVIVEKKPLARALYHQLEIGDVVPETFFKAVAEILAYVYRIKGKA